MIDLEEREVNSNIRKENLFLNCAKHRVVPLQRHENHNGKGGNSHTGREMHVLIHAK